MMSLAISGVTMVDIHFWGEHQNITHMKSKGAILILDFAEMSNINLFNALKTVINDTLCYLFTVQDFR